MKIQMKMSNMEIQMETQEDTEIGVEWEWKRNWTCKSGTTVNEKGSRNKKGIHVDMETELEMEM